MSANTNKILARISALTPVFAVLLALVSCAAITTSSTKKPDEIEKDPVPVENVSFDLEEITLERGETLTLTPKVSPDDAANKKLSYSSSDKNIAVVSSDGRVKALAAGRTTVTAVNEASGKSASVLINVSVKLEKMKFAQSKVRIKVGQSTGADIRFYPAVSTEADISKIEYESSDENIAAVVGGNIVALAEGKTSIKAKLGECECECTVICEGVPVERITLDCEEKTLKRGEKYQFTATVLPEDATDKTVKWYVTNTKVASVDENGVVSCTAKGRTALIAETNDWHVSAVCYITIK